MILSGAAVRIVWSQERPWDVRIIDVVSGRDYASETLELNFHLDARGRRWVELLMLTDADGEMQTVGGPAVLTADGTGYCKDTFRFEVTEMSVE